MPSNIETSEKVTFSFTLVLVIVIILSTLIIFALTPSPISPTKLYFGYIVSIWNNNNKTYIDFDKAQWLTDKEGNYDATTACINDNKCPDCSLPVTKSCLPNGYYIKNPENTTVTYPLASFAKVGTLLLSPDWDQSNPESKAYRTISPDELRQIFQTPESPDYWITTTPFDITVISGQVIIINQHYIP